MVHGHVVQMLSQTKRKEVSQHVIAILHPACCEEDDLKQADLVALQMLNVSYSACRAVAVTSTLTNGGIRNLKEVRGTTTISF